MDAKKNMELLNLKQQLNTKGCRLTGQRQAVLEVLLCNKGRHMRSEEIFELVRRSHPGIGLATVYRTLPLLESMNLIKSIYLNDGCIRYESCSPRGQLHHHLICVSCGAVCEIEDDLLELLDKEILSKNSFCETNYMVKLYGYCTKCGKESSQAKGESEGRR